MQIYIQFIDFYFEVTIFCKSGSISISQSRILLQPVYFRIFTALSQSTNLDFVNIIRMWMAKLSIRQFYFFNSSVTTSSFSHKKHTLRIILNEANRNAYFSSLIYFKKVRYIFYLATYSRPTSCELILTKTLAITHLLLGFDYRNEYIIYSSTVDLYAVYYFYVLSNNLAVKSYCLDTLSKNNNPSSSISPLDFLKSITTGCTNQIIFSPQA